MELAFRGRSETTHNMNKRSNTDKNVRYTVISGFGAVQVVGQLAKIASAEEERCQEG